MQTKRLINNLLRNKTVRNGGLFSIFSFFNRGISFLLLVLLASYIQPEQYGELSIFNTMVSFLGYFAGLSTAGYLNVSYFKKDKESFTKDFTAICVITLIVSLLIGLLFVSFHNLLSGWLKVSVPFLYLGVVISLASIFVQLNLDYLRVQEKVSKYGLLSCSFALLNFVLSLILVIKVDLNWHGRVYAQLFCDMLFAFIAIAWFLKDRLFIIPKEWKIYKTIAMWGIPLIPHHASIWLKQGMDRYIIEATHSMSDVGLFSFALNLVSVITMVGVAFNQTNSVNLYQTLSSNQPAEDKFARLKRKEKYFSLIYLIVSVVILAGGCILIPLIMPNYSAAIPYFIILSGYGLAQCIYFLYCNYLFYYNKTKDLMYITFGTSLIHLCLSLLLTRYSLYLTCGIYVITQTVVSLLVAFRSKKEVNNLLNNSI